MAGLKCFRRSDLTPIPGCPVGVSGVDYCYVPNPTGQAQFRIRHIDNPNMCMELENGNTNNFTRLVMKPCTSSSKQLFSMFKDGIEYKIKTEVVISQVCLEMSPNQSYGGVFIHSSCVDSWSWVVDVGGQHYIKNNEDGLCIGVSDPYSMNNAYLNRYTCGSSSAKFTFKWN